jgi:hypothetical protein
MGRRPLADHYIGSRASQVRRTSRTPAHVAEVDPCIDGTGPRTALRGPAKLLERHEVFTLNRGLNHRLDTMIARYEAD